MLPSSSHKFISSPLWLDVRMLEASRQELPMVAWLRVREEAELVVSMPPL